MPLLDRIGPRPFLDADLDDPPVSLAAWVCRGVPAVAPLPSPASTVASGVSADASGGSLPVPACAGEPDAGRGGDLPRRHVARPPAEHGARAHDPRDGALPLATGGEGDRVPHGDNVGTSSRDGEGNPVGVDAATWEAAHE